MKKIKMLLVLFLACCMWMPKSDAETYNVFFNQADGDCGIVDCTTGEDGKIKSCVAATAGDASGKYSHYEEVCSKWSTYSKQQNVEQPNGITNSEVKNKVFTENTSYYCVSGSSIVKNVCDYNKEEPPVEPEPPEKPETPVNPQTGSTFITIAWIVGIIALGYSVYYFVSLRINKEK